MPEQLSAKRQCSECGATSAIAIRVSSSGLSTTLVDYRCQNCGHVDQIARQDTGMWHSRMSERSPHLRE
jgi:ribosomal protein L37AE/L43A